MKVHGREINFLRTVKATCDLAELCPDGDLEKLDVIFSDKNVSRTQRIGAKLIHLMNEGYEMNKAYDDPTYEPHVISEEEVLYLDFEEYQQLFKEATQAFTKGLETQVETEPAKKKATAQE